MSNPNYFGPEDEREPGPLETIWYVYFHHWFTREWWDYLLKPPAEDVTRWKAFHCRRLGHPNGTIYYNPGGFSPDDRCKDCYDDLG